MIGCMILGGLAAFGIARLIHFRRCYGGGCGGWRSRRWHHGGWGHHGRFGHHGGGWGGGHGEGYDDEHGPGDDGGPERGGFRGGRGRIPFVVSFLSERLEATPAQERAIAAAVEEFRADMQGLRGELPKTRNDLAAALRKPAFDEVLLGELFARHDGEMEKARKALVGLVARLHDTLDQRQRDRLASLIERDGFVSRGFGW